MTRTILERIKADHDAGGLDDPGKMEKRMIGTLILTIRLLNKCRASVIFMSENNSMFFISLWDSTV